MLHELLAGLIGHESDLSMDHLPGLHPSEQQTMLQLGSLGTSYSHILSFVKQRQWQYKSCSLPTPPPGLYQSALAMGIQSVVLDPYRCSVVDLERQLLDPTDTSTRCGNTPLSVVYVAMSKFRLLFEHVLRVVQVVSDPSHPDHKQYQGLRILDLLRNHSICGIPLIRDVMHKLYAICMRVFCKQLVCWMMYGSLSDPHDEFFIVAKARTADSSSYSRTHSAKLDTETTTWTELFLLDSSRAPHCISFELSQVILFNGKALAIISARRPDSVDGIVQKFIDAIATLCQQEIYDIHEHQRVINETCIGLNRQVTRLLWEIVVLEENLPIHLKAIRDVLLAGRGDFILELLNGLDVLKNRFKTSFSAMTDQDTHRVFNKAWEKCEWQENVPKYAKPTLQTHGV
ncbi:hypothetical protein BASA83_000593 [Batrachochytrium salamandrivorans]|nr:hypothetical protein BASA83_000593 [Batrachochytrium salamandrivorans]